MRDFSKQNAGIDLNPGDYLERIQDQKRRFLLILSLVVMVASMTHAVVRWNNGLKLAAAFGGILMCGAVLALLLAWRRKVVPASHLLLVSAFLTTSLNQQAMASLSLGPVLNIFSIFIAAMYLLTPRWGLLYGLLGFARAIGIKAAQDTGLLVIHRIHVPESDWYSSLIVAFIVFGYLLYAMVLNHNVLLESYRQAAATRQKFLARLSHEIRNPLNALLGIGEVLSARIVDPEKQKYMATILDAGRSMLQIANQALEISRREGKKSSGDEIYDPKALLHQLLALFEIEARGKGLNFEADTGDAPDAVSGDAVAIREIITNLLHNALKFTEHGTIRLTLSCDREGETGWLNYSVSDTGRGIAPGKIAAIFEPYNQGDSPTAASEGVGLGLAICRELSEQMGGFLTAESRDGGGSTFRLSVPLRLPQQKTGSISSVKEESPLPAFSGTKRVLSADDEPTNQMLIRAFLDHPAIRLTTVESGTTAVAACAAETYDVVLLDLNIPDLSGIAALKEIRAAEVKQGVSPVPAIAVTASVMPEEIEQLQAAGFISYVSKPYSQRELFEAITAITR